MQFTRFSEARARKSEKYSKIYYSICMKLVLVLLLCIVLILILLAAIFGIARTIQIQNKPQQKDFFGGSVPKELPNGLYKGTVNLKTTWQGKRFDASSSAGINVFKNGDKREEKYPFKTYVGDGVQDKNLKVIKIDYSENQDPWWLKYILDEVVEVSSGKYLGKVHIIVIPGLPFTLGYFQLEK